jgi:hypothetical protein
MRHGFPPRAIVLARRLAAPWAELVHGELPLGELLARAKRPAHDEHSDDVVWFADEAELLACLAADALRGQLSRWWWRLCLRGHVTQRAAAARWLRSPRVLPRAARQLGPSAAAWFSSWMPSEHTELMRVLASTFPVPSTVEAWVSTGSPQRAIAQPVGSRSAMSIPPPASESSVAERMARLCVALAEAPSSLGLRDVTRERSHAPAPRGNTTVHRAASVTPRPSPPETTPPVRAPVRSVARAAAALAETRAPHGGAASFTPRAEEHEQTAPPRQPTRERVFADVPEAAPASFFETAFGGLFFSLNTALHLGLYGDFSQPMQRSLACSPWRFLLRAGSLWIRGFRADPLAAWLRSMDRRPVARRLRCSHWQLPGAWLEPFSASTGTWHAVFCDGWLRVVHPAGFAVLERPAQRGEDALRAELTRLGVNQHVALRRSVVSRVRARRRAQHGCPNALWPYLRARLELALPDTDLARMLAMPACCAFSGDRLDVTMSLQDLPLAVRFAGLDRDPGFIPAAGLDLRFAFR